MGIYSLHSVPWQKCLEGLTFLLVSALNTWISGNAGGKTGNHFHNTEAFVPVFLLLAYFSISQNCRTPMQSVIPTPHIISQLLQMLLPSHVAHPRGPAKGLSTFSSSKSIKPNFWRLLNTNSGSIQLYSRRHVGSPKFKQVLQSQKKANAEAQHISLVTERTN